MNKQAVIAFYIRNGAQRLIDYAESTINKKKNKKQPIVDEVIDYQTSVTHFIQIKPVKKSFDYFQKEILKDMQGKTRSNSVFNNQANLFIQDIHSFKVLYEKYLNLPKAYVNNQKQSQILRKNIEITFGCKIFNQQFEITEIAQSLRQISKGINQIKNKCKIQSNQQILQKIELNLLKDRSERLNYNYLMQKSDEIKKIKNSIFTSKPIDFQNLEQSEQIWGKIINDTIKRWFLLVLQSINMKDLMSSPTIIVQWQNSLIQKEKYQLMAQQINGKMMFQYEQKINNLKMSIKGPNFIKQAQLRQKKSVHVFPQKMDRQKPKPYKQFQQVTNFTQIEKLKNVPMPSIQANKSYQKMANRIQNLKNRQFSQPSLIKSEDQIDNIKQITKNQKISDVNIHEKKANRYTYQNKRVIPSPLRPQKMSKFKLISKDKSSQIPITNLNIQKQIINPRIRPKNQAKIQVKFPVKIQNFEMQSWTSSFLCYRTQKINLKQLPLVFMKDRHKYGQNKVKIEYPVSPQNSDIQLVYKSMQILNCLGAEVFCQEEISYKTVNQIDSNEILSMSWLLQKPVKVIIEYYGQFYAGCSTKK